MLVGSVVREYNDAKSELAAQRERARKAHLLLTQHARWLEDQIGDGGALRSTSRAITGFLDPNAVLPTPSELIEMSNDVKAAANKFEVLTKRKAEIGA